MPMRYPLLTCQPASHLPACFSPASLLLTCQPASHLRPTCQPASHLPPATHLPACFSPASLLLFFFLLVLFKISAFFRFFIFTRSAWQNVD